MLCVRWYENNTTKQDVYMHKQNEHRSNELISKNKQEPSPPRINEAHMMIVYDEVC